MKKSHTYTELSDVQCSTPGCRRRLKQRLVNQKPTVDKCYKCNRTREAGRGHFINTNARRKRVELGQPVKNFSKVKQGA